MIRELRKLVWTIRAISDETGFDPKTIGKYLNQDTLPARKPSKLKDSKLDPYKDYIRQRIKEGTTNCEVLFAEIKKQGYEGQRTILRDFVRPFRLAPKKQATVRFETPPGKQAQMDWTEVGEFLVDGKKQNVQAFVMILGYSRMRYVEFTTNMNLGTLMKCHMNAFAYFNGVPQQILYDNMRTAVTLHTPNEIRFNRKFEEFLAYYGIVPKARRPRRAQTKGKIERAIGYLKGNFLTRRQFGTLEQLNADVLVWLEETANRKVNQTTLESPMMRFELEKHYLNPTHAKPLYPIHHWEI